MAGSKRDEALSIAGVPGADQYASFREQARNAVAEGAGLIQGVDDKFKAWKANHPAVDWALSPGALPGLVAPGVGMLGAMTGGLLGPSKTEAAPPMEPASPAYQYQRSGPPDALNGAPPGNPPAAAPLQPRMSAGMGPGGDVAGGYGTDKSILNDQLNQIADHSGLQEKKAEEGAAHLGVMNTQAGHFQELAQAKAAAAQAERQVVDEVDKEQVEHETKIQSAIDETASKGVDPGRHFKNRDGIFWTNMLIGSVASGILSALNNQGNNPFMDSVRETVRQDINAQEKDIEQGWKKVKGMETAYERMRMRGADRITATIRQYDKTLESLQTDMQGRLLKATVPEVRANLEAGLQAIQLERDGMQLKMDEYWKNVRGQRAAAAAAAAERAWRHAKEMRELGIAESRARAQNARDYADADKQAAEAGGKGNERFVALGVDQGRGVQIGGLVADPKSRGEIEEAAQAHESTKKAIAEIRRLRGSGAEGAFKRFGTKTSLVTPSWETGVESETSALMSGINKASKLGAYDAGTAELLKKRVPDLKGVGTAGDDALDQLDKQIDRDFNAFINARGLVPAERGYDNSSGRSVIRETGGPGRATAGAGIGSIPGARPLGR